MGDPNCPSAGACKIKIRYRVEDVSEDEENDEGYETKASYPKSDYLDEETRKDLVWSSYTNTAMDLSRFPPSIFTLLTASGIVLGVAFSSIKPVDHFTEPTYIHIRL